MRDLIIRKLDLERRGDRQAVRTLCADTGYLGEPIENVFEDRELWSSMMIDPYLDLQEDACQVVEAAGRVVGYLAGCRSRSFEWRALPARVRAVLKMLGRMRRYGPRSREFVRWLLLRSWREKVSAPPGHYAHFHFNLDAEYRGNGCGSQMLDMFEAELRRHGVARLYAQALVESPRDEEIWEKLGFVEYERRPTTMFSPRKLYWVTWVKPLRTRVSSRLSQALSNGSKRLIGSEAPTMA